MHGIIIIIFIIIIIIIPGVDFLCAVPRQPMVSRLHWYYWDGSPLHSDLSTTAYTD